jgi:hypothetical protein
MIQGSLPVACEPHQVQYLLETQETGGARTLEQNANQSYLDKQNGVFRELGKPFTRRVSLGLWGSVCSFVVNLSLLLMRGRVRLAADGVQKVEIRLRT